ncbi:hypothetical protein HMPREF1579_01241 [Gardnerella vaginalis JCP8066]|nr:hypothetical protein HMPREF1579_01241 [Gardnerella vaginalis JCP8066]
MGASAILRSKAKELKQKRRKQCALKKNTPFSALKNYSAMLS